MTEKQWKKYRMKIVEIIEFFGGAIPLSNYLEIRSTNIYQWISRNNFKNGKLKRRISIQCFKKIKKKMPHLRLEDVLPQFFSE